jgi:hypothetical protein
VSRTTIGSRASRDGDATSGGGSISLSVAPGLCAWARTAESRSEASATNPQSLSEPRRRLRQIYVEQVYAKTLVPGPQPTPALMATTNEADVLVPQLLERGGARFGDPMFTGAAGRLVIGSDRLHLVVDEQALLADANPWAPDGWWAAVDKMLGLCMVVIARDCDIDLANANVGNQLAALLGTGRAVAAMLPVETAVLFRRLSQAERRLIVIISVIEHTPVGYYEYCLPDCEHQRKPSRVLGHPCTSRHRRRTAMPATTARLAPTRIMQVSTTSVELVPAVTTAVKTAPIQAPTSTHLASSSRWSESAHHAALSAALLRIKIR